MNEVGDGAVEAKPCLFSRRKEDDLPRTLSSRPNVYSLYPSPPQSVREINFHSTFPSSLGVQRNPDGGQKTPKVLFMRIAAQRVTPGRERGTVPKEGPGVPGGAHFTAQTQTPHRENHHQPRSPTSSAVRDVGFKEERKGRSRIEREWDRDPWDLGSEKGCGRGGERGAGITVLPDHRAGRRSLVRERGCENGKRMRPAAKPFPARSPAVTAQEPEGTREAPLAAATCFPRDGPPEPPKL